jgi:hypothetical protein
MSEDIRAALDRGRNRHAAEPVSAWRHFRKIHPAAPPEGGTDRLPAPRGQNFQERH